jgi:hypothetical protein
MNSELLGIPIHNCRKRQGVEEKRGVKHENVDRGLRRFVVVLEKKNEEPE